MFQSELDSDFLFLFDPTTEIVVQLLLSLQQC